MSKLSDCLHFEHTEPFEVRAKRTKTSIENFSSSVEWSPITFSYDTEQKVTVEATFRYNGWISKKEHGGINGKEAAQFLNDVKLKIIEDIFGEFRPLISQLRIALYDNQSEKARELLNQLEKQMFKIN